MPTDYSGARTITVPPSIRGSTAPTSSFTPSTPSSTQVGDLILVFHLTTASGVPAFGLGSGWNLLATQTVGTSPGTRLCVFWRIARVAGAQVCSTGNAIGSGLAGVVVIAAGTYDERLFPSSVNQASVSVATNSPPDPPAITTKFDQSLVLAVGAWAYGSGTTTTVTHPASYSGIWDASGSHSVELAVASRVITVAGTENPGAFADDTTPTGTIAMTITIPPYTWSDNVPVVAYGEDPSEAVWAPAWKACVQREQWLKAQMLDSASKVSSGSPLWTETSSGDSSADVGADGRLDIAGCKVGDRIFVDVFINHVFTALPTTSWDLGVKVVDDAIGIPTSAADLPGAFIRTTIPTGVGAVGYEANLRQPLRLTGMWTVTKAGTTRIYLGAAFVGGTPSWQLHRLSIQAERFPYYEPVGNGIYVMSAETGVYTLTGHNANLVHNSFNPATLAATGWWRTNYSASPWVGTASAGNSGNQNLSEATNPPTTGAPINSLVPADFNGTAHILSGAALSDFFTVSAWTILMLVNIDVVNTGGDGQGELLADFQGTLCIGTRDNSGSKVFVHQYDGTWKTLEVAVTTGSWVLVQAKFGGGQLRLRTNSNSWSTLACGNNASLAGAIRIGKSRDTFNKFFNGRVAETFLMGSLLSDSLCNDFKSYINARYGLSL